jgi:anti-anti-sigma factor
VATTPLLRVDVLQESPNVVVVSGAGELDLTNCDELREAINWSFTSDLSILRLDMTALSFFNSVGVNCLLQCHQSCTTLGVDLEIAPSPVVAKVLDLVGFRAATEARILPPAPPRSATARDSENGTAD